MDAAIGGLADLGVFGYIDDVAVINSDEEEHLEALKATFAALYEAGFEFSAKKCHASAVYLVHNAATKLEHAFRGPFILADVKSGHTTAVVADRSGAQVRVPVRMLKPSMMTLQEMEHLISDLDLSPVENQLQLAPQERLPHSQARLRADRLDLGPAAEEVGGGSGGSSAVSDAERDGYYTIDKVVDTRVSPVSGEAEYLVSWIGYDEPEWQSDPEGVFQAVLEEQERIRQRAERTRRGRARQRAAGR